MEHLKKVLRLTAGVGEELLRCGAEIARVEDTMNRIALHYGVTRRQIFIISNGVFVNLEMDGEAKNVSIEHIPEIIVNLDRLCEINNLSREIEYCDISLDEALERFDHIREGKPQKKWVNILASGIGAGAFCCLFGGDWTDCLGAVLTGLLICAFFTVLQGRGLTKMLLHIAGSAMVTAVCIAMFRTGIVHHLDQTIVGAIIPMIPGVAFVNGVRDLADGDYISGAVRLLDALLIFTSIATGVYLALHLGGRI